MLLALWPTKDVTRVDFAPRSDGIQGFIGQKMRRLSNEVDEAHFFELLRSLRRNRATELSKSLESRHHPSKYGHQCVKYRRIDGISVFDLINDQ